jgi:hypothetical protein
VKKQEKQGHVGKARSAKLESHGPKGNRLGGKLGQHHLPHKKRGDKAKNKGQSQGQSQGGNQRQGHTFSIFLHFDRGIIWLRRGAPASVPEITQGAVPECSDGIRIKRMHASVTAHNQPVDVKGKTIKNP